MPTDPDPARDISIPGAALVSLRDAIARESGPLASVQALQSAGYETGELLFERLVDQLDDAVGEVHPDDFWSAIADFFRDRGWGSLSFDQPHDGVGVLRSDDWIEGAGPTAERQASCSFSSGLLSGLLTRVAGDAVAVLQIGCRGRGDDHCAFAFGSEATMHELYGTLLEEADVGEALARL